MVASVSVRVAAASFAVGAVVLFAVWLTDLSFERAALLAPVLVIGVAAAAGLLVLWGRVGWAHFRESRHPRVIVGAAVAILVVGGALTVLGVKLARELGLSEITASVLARRGYGDPEDARAFLAGEQPLHDPFALGDMAAACEAIRAAVAAGKAICVHGDYDADGICATALAVLTLRELGADVSWHLPSRFDEGYGVNRETLARLARDGCGLVLTVDCGITAVEEVAEAKQLGLEVVVTDHHQPGERLPDCPLVVTRPSEYPFPELCGTGVVFKLAQALLGPESEALRLHLDLVALATVADVVPLVGENRSLAIAGLRALTRTRKPGLRALMKSARVDAAALDEASIGFRLAPRINAAGRLGHPATALELLLTEDATRAESLAAELETLNRQRQAGGGSVPG